MKIVFSSKLGKDKTSYITRFRLADFIKRDLFSKVNKGLFVLMFDESLNKTIKFSFFFLRSVWTNLLDFIFFFFLLFQQDFAEQYGGAQLVAVGSCGLHTL